MLVRVLTFPARRSHPVRQSTGQQDFDLPFRKAVGHSKFRVLCEVLDGQLANAGKPVQIRDLQPVALFDSIIFRGIGED